MEWKTPQIGDRRERISFAWFPFECEDGKTRWLCRLRFVWQFQPNMNEFPPLLGWYPIRAYPLDAD